MPNDSEVGEEPQLKSRYEKFGDALERLYYAIGLGTATFILMCIPMMLWPKELGKFLNSYTYTATLVIAYSCVPFARRYMPRIKPRR